MRHCFLCGGDYADETRMVMAEGGSEICQPCAATERGQRLTTGRWGAKERGYAPGSHVKGQRFKKALEHWSRHPLPPRH
jgi:hypothetical protein